MSQPELKRTIGPAQMALYAIGSMLGAGIYGLIGQAAGYSGNAVWLSFMVALVAALLTGLTYASLGARYPRAGGTAFIIERAFQSPRAGFVAGACLAAAALIGIPTMAQVFARNFADIFSLSESMVPVVTVTFLAMLGLIIFRGIREALWLNVLCCIIEAGGLLLIIGVGFSCWGQVDYMDVPPQASTVLPSLNTTFVAVMSSTVLTFMAFIGFEDTLNLAEETKNPQRTLPIGILVAMAVVAVIYIAVAITVVSVVPWQQLAQANSPLTEVIRVAAPAIPPALFTAVALFSVTNTIMVNYVTASRLLYGMAQQKLMPALLGRVHATRQTPHMAVLALFICFLPFSIFGSIAQLAAASTLLLLIVFAMMNVSLLVLQRRKEEKGAFEIHPVIPAMGAVVCTLLIIARVMTGEWTAPVLAGGIAALVLVIYLVAAKRKTKV